MNAQQLIQETTKESFGDFKVFFKSQSSKVNNLPHSEQKGDEFVARQGNIEYPQARSTKGFTPLLTTKEPNNSLSLEAPLDPTLMPQTLNFTKLNNARRDLEWQKEMKELNIQQL